MSDFFIVLVVVFELGNRVTSTVMLVRKSELSSTDVATQSHAYMNWNRQNLLVSLSPFYGDVSTRG